MGQAQDQVKICPFPLGRRPWAWIAWFYPVGEHFRGVLGVALGEPREEVRVIGDVRDLTRFASRDRFAAYNGTAPIEVSSGNRVVHRLSLRGNRRLNHAIHMAAITQIRYKHSDGRCRRSRNSFSAASTPIANGLIRSGMPAFSQPRRRPTGASRSVTALGAHHTREPPFWRQPWWSGMTTPTASNKANLWWARPGASPADAARCWRWIVGVAFRRAGYQCGSPKEGGRR